MKEMLALLGKLPPAVVRPPLLKLPEAEIARLRRAIAASGLASGEIGRDERAPLAAE
jgi:4-hydroxy-tetrahydrodipicolinate synthase